jgi:Zn-dependent protease/CBS domain-containing protein
MSHEHTPGALRLLQVGGVPVYVHFTWLLVFGLVTWTLAGSYFPARSPGLAAPDYWSRGLVTALLLFASILVHEGAHAVVARRRGLEVRSVTLFLFGGVARIDRDASDGRTELRMALAGPAVSLLLAALFGLATLSSALFPTARDVTRALGSINLGLALFNLLPAFPLDGGRVLRGLLWKRLGRLRATAIAVETGSVFALGLMAGGAAGFLLGAPLLGAWSALVGWFLLDAAGAAYRQLRVHDATSGLTVADVMTRRVVAVPAFFPVDEALRTYLAPTGFGTYPVVRDGAVVGLLRLTDVLRLPESQRRSRSVQSLMAPVPEGCMVPPEMLLGEALERMSRTGQRRLVVVEGGRLAGLLTLSAALRQSRLRERLGRAA